MKRNSVPDHSIFQKSYGYSIYHNFIACYFFCLPKECPRPWHSIEKKYITYLIVHNEKKNDFIKYKPIICEEWYYICKYSLFEPKS